MLSYRISVPGPTFDNFSPIFFFFLPTWNAKSYSLTVTVLVILLQEIINMIMHGNNECLPLLVPACARVKYSSQELSMLLCEPVQQMRSSMSVKYVCVCTHPNEGECTCRQKHLQTPVSCLFHLRGSTSCPKVTLCVSLVFIHQGRHTYHGSHGEAGKIW